MRTALQNPSVWVARVAKKFVGRFLTGWSGTDLGRLALR